METSVMHGKAVASLVLGICAIVCWFLGLELWLALYSA